MAPQILVCLLFVAVVSVVVDCKSEGDALIAWKTNLIDPNGILQSWDPQVVDPCTWFHVTCNLQNSVVSVNLGNTGLSGTLVPELGLLQNLQYLSVYNNNISGLIPTEIGNLTNLVILDLQHNQLSGPIPPSLGNLVSLLYMYLNSNHLSGTIPTQVIHLNETGKLWVMNLSDNMLEGTVHRTNLRGFTVTKIIQDPRAS